MTAVLDVLEHELPVRGEALAGVAQDRERSAVEHPVVEGEHLAAEICLERRRLAAKRTEDRSAPCLDADSSEAVLAKREIRRHAAHALHPAAKRQPREP